MTEHDLRHDVLCGDFFHSWKEHDCGCRLIEWQGEILGRVNVGVYLVQLFDWITGSRHERRLVRLDQMELWTFYDSVDEMNQFYEHSYSGTWRRHEPHERGA